MMRKKLFYALAAIFAVGSAAGVAAACEKKQPSGSGNGDVDPVPPPPIVKPDTPEYPSEIGDASNVAAVTVGDVRIQLLSDTLVRIEQKGEKGFENRESYIVSNRSNWQNVEFTQSVENDETVISTSEYIVHVPSGAQAEEVYVTDKNGNVSWRFEGMTDTNVYLPSPSDELKSWYFTDSPRIIPSEYGYSVNESGGPLQDWDFDNNATDVFVFLPQGDYKRFCSDYTSLTGKSEFVSLQMLGFWDSRWYAYSSETALQQIKDYTDRGYSIDVLVIDTDWRTAASGTGYEINKELFPDMAGFLDKCHDLGVNVIFNDHPEPVTSGSGLDSEEVKFRTDNLTLILSLGLDYWWYDRNWSVALNSIDPDISVFAFGMYAYNWITSEYLESITDLNEYAERALIMGNVDGCLHGKWNYASDISAHRYTIQWTGDIGATSDALAQEIYAAVFGGAEVGIPYMSSDIGGHTQPVTDSMYCRWFQYGALSSILRVHCTHANYIGQEGRMPWMFGDTAEEVAHTYMDMRYRLLPLYYAIARENYDCGLPTLRRLDINYPQYVESSRNDEYLLGDYILVAPINEALPNVLVDESRLTHTVNGSEVPGLKASYYGNSRFEGSPAVRTDSNINFDWGTSGPAGCGSDNFSIIWSGNIKIGPKPAKLAFFADDSVIVYIDGKKVIDSAGKYDNYLLTENSYAANSTHTIEVRYVEEAGNAHIYMYYVEDSAVETAYNTRSVFLPEGAWIDVWTGEKYSGPITIDVSHTLKTSPIFVREGSLIALARNMTNTSEKDWSELSLDVYPSVDYSAKTCLYEDDTKTVAYKSGKYRTTDITLNYDKDKGALLVNIDKAKGSFDGDLAFDKRSWNVRVHGYADWGEVTKVRVNGKLMSVEQFARSAAAKPFAYSGAALDGAIYEFKFEGSVYERYEIEIYFESVKGVELNKDYDATAIEFDVKAGASGNSVNLSELGTIGWTSFGDSGSTKPVNKSGVQPVIEYVGSYDTPWIEYNPFFTKTYNGTGGVLRSTGAIASQKDFSIKLETNGKKTYYVLYVGGNQCSAKLTVRDRAGNVKTVMFGNINGRFMRRVVIECGGPNSGTLYVTYSMHASETSGTGSPSNLTLMCGYAATEVGEISGGTACTADAEIKSSENPPAVIDLSNAGSDLDAETLDWMQFSENGANPERRTGGHSIENVQFRSGQGFGDYSSVITYSDGDKIVSHTGTRNGTCTSGSLAITCKVAPNVKFIRLYTGAYKSTNVVEVYNANGQLLSKSQPFTAGGTATTRVVTIAVKATAEETLTIVIQSIKEEGGGNVSLAAMAVLGEFDGESGAALDVANTAAVSGSVDLAAVGDLDWKYIVGNAEKQDAGAIGAVTYSAFKNDYDDYAAAFDYDGETGASSGRECDFARFDVTVNANTKVIELYVSAENYSSVGITVLDSEGRAVLRAEPVKADAERKCMLVKISVSAEQAETLTFICYKGGSVNGRFGLAAIAVSAEQA